MRKHACGEAAEVHIVAPAPHTSRLQRLTGAVDEARAEAEDVAEPPAGVSLFTLARGMGTSVQTIDRTYGRLAPDAEEYERTLLDAYDALPGGLDRFGRP